MRLINPSKLQHSHIRQWRWTYSHWRNTCHGAYR